jgi:glycosyltransferase involved in cell wall biosynthesis
MQVPIRVAHVHHYLPFGGVETQIQRLCAHLPRARFHNEVLLFQAGGPMVPVLQELDIPVEVFPVLRPDGSIDAPARAALVARLRGFDLVHSWYGGGPQSLAVAAAAEAQVPAQVQSLAWLVPALDGPLDAVICDCEALVRLQPPALPGRIARIPPGIDLTRFDPRRFPARPAGAPPRVGRISRLVPVKDPQSFLVAAAALQDLWPAAEFVLHGEGPLRAELTTLAQGLGARVAIPGAAHDVPAALAALDVFAFAPAMDCNPNVVFEALAMGIPVVASRVGGIPEVLEAADCGILVPPGDAGAQAEAIAQLLADPQRARAMGARGRSLVAERYSFTRYIADHAALYEQVLAKRNVSASPARRIPTASC